MFFAHPFVVYLILVQNTSQCEARLIISDPQLREVAEDKMSKMKTWLDMKLEEAKIAAAQQENGRDNDDSKFLTVKDKENDPQSPLICWNF